MPVNSYPWHIAHTALGHAGTNLTSAGGIGYTIVDSIDTMLIMGLDEEYKRARKWIAMELTFDRDANFSTFEVPALLFVTS